jgi:hypothetical protein
MKNLVLHIFSKILFCKSSYTCTRMDSKSTRIKVPLLSKLDSKTKQDEIGSRSVYVGQVIVKSLIISYLHVIFVLTKIFL